ncbi:MAG TPA: peptide MFS transporter [Thermoanaerobaculia bacterium]|nr:peptide MFS transporter [Thermoanaerobaculia bacterium]
MADAVAMGSAADKEFLGHPRGLTTLFFTEMWERFSYYGMRALLMLYMVGSVLQPGLGFGVRRAAWIYSTYTMMVYLMGMPGGFIADRWLGHYRAVLVGGIIIACGHFSMAVPDIRFFYLGLCLIVIGTGLLKPNVSSLVGALYSKDDHRRDSGFSVFYMGINLGAFFSPIVCGWLGQMVNWHFGFAAAGVGMVFGLIQYVTGRKYLRTVMPQSEPTAGKLVDAVIHTKVAPLSAGDWKRMGALVMLAIFALIFWAGFEQAGSSLTLFADRATRLTIFGFKYPSSLFQSAEPLFVLILSLVFAWMWLRLGRLEPSSPAKFTLGLVFLSLSFLLIIPAARMFESTKVPVSPMWLVGLYFLQAVGELCLSPIGLSLVTKLSPPRLVGLMMGVWFVAMGMGNSVAGFVAGFLQNRSFTEVFQPVFIAITVAAVILALMIAPINKLARKD